MSKTDLNALSLKKKQINLLKERFSHTIEVVKDSTFKIPFLGIHLLISLPVDFPNSPPAYFLEILQTHQPISLPPNYKWTSMSNLATVTIHIMEPYVKDSKGLENLIDQAKRQQIIQQQQQQQPPQPIQPIQQQPQTTSQRSNSISSSNSIQYSPPPPYKDQSNVVSPPTPSNSTTATVSTSQRSNSISSPTAAPALKIPSIPIEFTELKNKSIQELEELINNEDSMNAFIYSFDDVSELSDQKSKLLSENERLSKISDPLPNQIKQLKDELETKKILYDELQKQHLILQAKRKEISDRYSHGALLEKLNDSISELELESDNIVYSFLNDSTIELKEFKKLFKEKRSIYHSKCANRENLI